MRYIIHCIGILTMICSPALLAQEPASPGYVVITHSSKADVSITSAELVRVFSGKSQIWTDKDESYVPVTVSEENGALEAFTSTVLHKSVEQYKALWNRILFSGSGVPPKTFRTSAEVVNFVATTPGAIAVIEANTELKDVVPLTIR